MVKKSKKKNKKKRSSAVSKPRPEILKSSSTTTSSRLVKRRNFGGTKRRARRVGGSLLGSFKTGLIGKVFKGLGAGMLFGVVAARVAPGVAPIASTAGAALVGGLPGLAAQMLLNFLSGQPILGIGGLGASANGMQASRVEAV